MTPALLAGLLGVAQGVRHALEPDHVTAVATVMVREKSARRGMAFAASWGVGHGTVVIAVGGLLAALRAKMPDAVGGAFELAVGVMLVALGVRALRDSAKTAEAPHGHAHLLRDARRPFVIGVVHGLAGSGALAALFAVGAPSTAAALAGLALYAIGTTLGMSMLAGAAGPLLARAGRKPNVATAVVRVAGALSVILGVAWTAKSVVELVTI